MKKIIAALAIATFTQINLFAQWETYSQTNSPIKEGINVPHVAADVNGNDVYVVTRDTSYHLYYYSKESGWESHPQLDSILGTINAIYDTKYSGETLWMQTSKGIAMLNDEIFGIIPYENGVSSGTNGLVVMSDNEIWFVGGQGGRGITRLHLQQGWTYIDGNSHPNFKQDIGLTDLKYNNTTNTLWVAANCFGADAGVYAYSIDNNTLTQYKPEGKYNCVHAVEPTPTHLFVGTANFSSMRMMNYDGTYIQTLNSPKITWVTETRLDPADPSKVWILTERGLMHFKDTSNYKNYTVINTPLDGFMNELSVAKVSQDSFQLWIGTTTGLFSYTYKSGLGTGVHEVHDMEIAHISPNPTTGLIKIESKVSGKIKLTVVNLQGKLVYETHQDLNENATVDLSSLENGLYFMIINSEQRIFKQKLVRIN